MKTDVFRNVLEEKLIGKTFKRNKYGKSNWEDKIVEVWITSKQTIGVEGSHNVYSIDEVMILNDNQWIDGRKYIN